ncbi:MAG: zinc-binding dehydrogenase [Alphaproteobacteria bacterium]|nr:zinc-binding dehydrogenase [Alphaproteobacteria bacterium]
MRAAWYEQLGPARDVLTVGDIETPSPQAGEVLVKLAASGINPSDVKKRAGWHGGTLEYERIAPHSDGAGVIEAVGADVPEDRIGERVWIFNGQRFRALGTAAEYIALPAEQAVPLPDAVDFGAGACLGIPACTAHYALFWQGPLDGLTVLVQGGAGAVGQYAIQLAALAGARVIATVSSPEKAAMARNVGALETIDYRKEDVVAAVQDFTDGAGVDHIVEVHFGANFETDAEILKPRGVIAAYSSTRAPRFDFDYYALGYKGARVAFVQAYLLNEAERAAAIVDLTRFMESGELRHDTRHRFPLDRIADAHELMESGTALGNIVLEI